MKHLLLASFLILTACSSPSIRFRDPPVRVEVEGWTIDVYRNGEEVQAIRVNSTWRPRGRDMLTRGVWAIEHATGCTVVRESIEGDVVLLNAQIEC